MKRLFLLAMLIAPASNSRAQEDAAANINQAIAALPAIGGTVDLRTLQGSQALAATIRIDRPVNLLLGAVTLTCSANPCFEISNGRFTLEGAAGQTKLISATDGRLFNVSSALEGKWSNAPIRFKDMEWQGGGGSSQATFFPRQSISETQIIFEGLTIHGFGATTGALEFGDSVYFIDIRNCTFYENQRSIQLGKYDEVRVQFCEFYHPRGGPHIRAVGMGHTWIEDNEFMYGREGKGEAPDLQIEPFDAAGNGGSFVRVNHNKFGNDVQDNPRRYKIQIGADDPRPVAAGPIWITQNDFKGPPDGLQKAIGITNPVGGLRILDNYFWSFNTVVNDIAPPAAAGSSFHGQSIFQGNNIWGGDVVWTLFTHGGRDFQVIEPPAELIAAPASYSARGPHETRQLNNRLPSSEDFNLWKKAGVTVTAGQTDPFGGNRARMLERSGTAGAEYVYANVDGSPLPSSLFVRVWLKAGSLRYASVLLFNNTDSKAVERPRKITLGPDWAEYRSAWNGLDPSKSYSLYIYPGATTQQSGSIYAFGAQVADQDSDYFSTLTASMSTAAYGTRYDNGVIVERLALGGQTPPDTTLYRAGAGTLKTDGAMEVGGNLSVAGGLLPSQPGTPLGNSARPWQVYTRVVPTRSLPAPGPSMDGTLLIDDSGTGDRNLVIYAGGQRFHVDGGSAF